MKLWQGYPTAHRDITVSIYSKQTLEIKDAYGNNYVEHYDGSLPTGFTESTYRGMNPPSTDPTPTDPTPTDPTPGPTDPPKDEQTQEEL